MLDIREIRERLLDRNLTAVSKKMHLSRPYLSDIRSGKREPSKLLQKRLSEYLGGKNAT